MCLIQIGSGSANLDTYIHDGFTSFVKKKNIKNKILIVEANSTHLHNLKNFWKNNLNVKIFNLAVELKDYDFKRYGSVTSNILITSTDGSKHQITFNPNSHSEDVSSEVLEIVELIKNLA